MIDEGKFNEDSDHDNAFNEAFERVAMNRLSGELGPIFRAHGHGLVDTAASDAEALRVKVIIDRDKVDRVREIDRRAAELEVAGGRFINLDNTVIEPTPEWLDKGDVRSFTPRQPDATARVIRSVRRVVTPVVARMHIAGKLTDEQFSACMWYRARHEAAGLEGRYKTSHLSLAGNVGGGGGGAQSPMAQHAYEAQARQEFRTAREAITAFYRKFFDAVALHDTPLRRASRFARCRNGKAPRRFRDCCEELVRFCQSIDVDFSSDGGAD